MLGFTIVAGLALAIFAAAVLLPAWHRRELARTQRDELAARVWTYDQLVDYKQRIIDTIKSDPLQTQRLLMLQQNYRRPGDVAVAMENAPVELPPLVQLAARAPTVQPPSPSLLHLAERLEDPRTRRGLMLLAGILMVGAMLLFLPPSARPTRGKKV
jgi:hypothetical protein